MKMKKEPRQDYSSTHAMNIIYTELVRLLGPLNSPRGQTIMMVGLYGQKETTTTAKLANGGPQKSRRMSL